MKKLLSYLIVAAIAAGTTWLALKPHDKAAHDHGAKKVLFYQSPMHPWVKSDKPGRCTVCGMELVPVYEGEKSMDSTASDTGIVMLPASSPNVVGIQTTEVKKQPLVRTMRVAGLIDDDDSRHRILSAYSKGRVEKLFVNFEGAEVEAGQPLATFYSQDLLSAARDYKLASTQSNTALMQASATRLQQLGLTPAQITKVPVRSDNDLVFDILAPIGGTVVKRHVYEGQYVEEGGQLFEIADFSKMWFQFIAYEQDLPFIAVGQQVEITTAALPGRSFKAAIKFINPNMDNMTRSARVRVEVENPDRSLRHKLYGEAVVSLDAPEVLTVPRQAVLWPGTQPRVFVEKAAGSYQQRNVRLGRVGDAYWEVLEGLKEGERIVLTGNMLIDGQAQLDAMVMATGALEPAAPVVAMSEKDRAPLLAWFTAVATVNDALANDDLAAANAALKKLPPAPPGLIKTPAPAPSTDIKELRKTFLPWSQEVAAVAANLRPQFPALKVFRCPMTNDLWSGAPANAKWIQLTAELRNPYWGKEMQDCGTEVKP